MPLAPPPVPGRAREHDAGARAVAVLEHAARGAPEVAEEGGQRGGGALDSFNGEKVVEEQSRSADMKVSSER